jgi:hypothetical protein
MWRLHIACVVIAACIFQSDRLSWGQMVTTQMPLQSNSSSFYEQSHIAWGLQTPHYFMNFNGGGAFPPYGGYQPNAGIHTGFAVGNAHFDLGFVQGASLGSSTVAPVLTTTNGYPGFLFDGIQRPFVTGVMPQVGGAGFFSVPSDPLTSRMAAGEFRMENRRVVVPGVEPAPQIKNVDKQPRAVPAAVSVAKTSESTASRDLTAAQYFERAAIAEKEGRSGVAKIYYQLAATKGDAVIKAQAVTKLDELKASSAVKP